MTKKFYEKSNNIHLLNLKYGSAYIKAKEINHSDWALFVNRVDSLVNAVNEFESLKIESNMIHVAFNSQFRIEMETLDNQLESLKSRNML